MITIDPVIAARIDAQPKWRMPPDLLRTIEFLNLILSLRGAKS